MTNYVYVEESTRPMAKKKNQGFVGTIERD